MRNISAYSGKDLFIGIYNNFELATQQKNKLHQESFPNEKQTIYLVSELSEGFGQIDQKLIFISTDKEQTKKFIQIKEEEEPESEFFEPYYEYEELTLNSLDLVNI